MLSHVMHYLKSQDSKIIGALDMKIRRWAAPDFGCYSILDIYKILTSWVVGVLAHLAFQIRVIPISMQVFKKFKFSISRS